MKTETRIPGLRAKHTVITPECRQARREDGAFDEAVARLREAYCEIIGAWPPERGAKIHMVLTVEPPE